MKKILFLSLFFFGFLLPVKAKECNLTSENNPEVVITIDEFGFSVVNGKLKYKNKPKFLVGFNRLMGYGGQKYNLKTLEGQRIGGGSFIGFVGNQVGRGTPSDKRIKGERRGLLIDFGRLLYYHLDTEERFNPSATNKALLNVGNGFFKLDDGCKFFPYMSWADD